VESKSRIFLAEKANPVGLRLWSVSCIDGDITMGVGAREENKYK
jgi:hypothetical protein